MSEEQEKAMESRGEKPDGSGVEAAPVTFGPLEEKGVAPEEGQKENLSILLDVPVTVSAEIGKTTLPLEKILSLGPGAVVELDKKSEEPIDVRVNGKLIAMGEVVVVDDSYGIRITQVVDPAARIESLRQA